LGGSSGETKTLTRTRVPDSDQDRVWIGWFDKDLSLLRHLECVLGVR
jgi:hypothetical protein